MKRARTLLMLPLLWSLSIMSQCHGAPTVHLDASDRATGITELDIGGAKYDGEFLVGPAGNFWPTIKTATCWGDPTAANAAVNAMVDALNSSAPTPSELADFGGAVAPFPVSFTVPHSSSGPTPGIFDLTAAYGVLDGGTWDNKGSSGAASASGFYPWASFSLSSEVRAVPAPSAMALAVTGMMSLLGVGRLRRRHWGPQQDLI